MSTNFEDLILRDATANQPAAGKPGRLFYDTDLEKWQRDNGATWDDCEPAAGAATDNDAIHDNVSAEISAVTEKTTLHADDLFLIEDSQASNAKKRVKRSNVLAGATGLLAVTSYNPNTQTTVSTTSTAGEDVDATNLTITFTVPASGKVLVVLDAVAYHATQAQYYMWVLRTTGGSNVAGTKRQITGMDLTTARYCTRIYITGLTPGASVTYRWGHLVQSSTGNIRYGDDGSTVAQAGAATMEVWAAP
jgi:hypothetical protein